MAFEDTNYRDVYLCETDKTIIGAIKVEDLETREKWNNYSEASFTAFNKYIDMTSGETKDHPLFDKIEQLRKVFISGTGYYIIQEAPIQKDAHIESKSCLLFSEEYELTQKYLEDFEINSGEVSSIDGVKFYDQNNPSKSLLHLVLEKIPTWSVGYVAPSLKNIERTYQVDREDIYDFLMNDVANTTKCIFEFDTYNNLINVYTEDLAGEDTGIYISLMNLAREINVKYNADDIKTVLTVTGNDDLDIREVNLGLPYIMNLSYYTTVDWMGEDLYNAYINYLQVVEDGTATYAQLIEAIDEAYDDVNELENKRNSFNPSTDVPTPEALADCGLNQLNEILAYYKEQQMIQVEMGLAGQPHDSADYERYAQTYMYIGVVEGVIETVNGQIDVANGEIYSIQEQMDIVCDNVAIKNNFTTEQLNKLSYFMREDEYSDSNFLVIETDTDKDILELKQSLLETAEKELDRICQPQLEFDADIENIYNIPEFSPLLDNFKVGNFISVEIRDGYVLKVRILEVEKRENDPTSLIITFGNLLKTKNQADVHAELLAQATSAGKSVASNSSYWQRGADKATETDKRIERGLIDSVTSLKADTGTQAVEWDSYGLHLRKKNVDGTYDPKEGWITNNQMVYSSDNFRTARSVFGEYTVNGESRWGVLAEAVIAGYIEGSTIVGSRLQSTNYSEDDETGAFIDLSDGAFSLADGRIRFIKNQNDQWQLDIVADSVSIGDESVSEIIDARIDPIQQTLDNLAENTESLNYLHFDTTTGLTILNPQTEDNYVNIASDGVSIQSGNATATLAADRFNTGQIETPMMFIGSNWVWTYRSASDHISLKYVGGDS